MVTIPSAPFVHAVVFRSASGDYSDELPAFGYPNATILELGGKGIRTIVYDETPQVELTRAFLDDPRRFLRHLPA
jgi:hypothetical protein